MGRSEKMNDKKLQNLIKDSAMQPIVYDGVEMPDMSEKIKLLANSVHSKTPNQNFRSEKMMETIKTQRAPRSKFLRIAAASMACVLMIGAVIGGYFLFRGGNNNMSLERARELLNTVCTDLGLIEASKKSSVQSSNVSTNNVASTDLNEFEKFFENDLEIFIKGSLMSQLGDMSTMYISFGKFIVDRCAEKTFYQNEAENDFVKFYFELKEKAVVFNFYFGFNNTKYTLVVKDSPTDNLKWSVEIATQVQDATNGGIGFLSISCTTDEKITFFSGGVSDKDGNFLDLEDINSPTGFYITVIYYNEISMKQFTGIGYGVPELLSFSTMSDDQMVYVLNYIQKSVNNLYATYPAVDFEKVNNFTNSTIFEDWIKEMTTEPNFRENWESTVMYGNANVEFKIDNNILQIISAKKDSVPLANTAANFAIDLLPVKNSKYKLSVDVWSDSTAMVMMFIDMDNGKRLENAYYDIEQGGWQTLVTEFKTEETDNLLSIVLAHLFASDSTSASAKSMFKNIRLEIESSPGTFVTVYEFLEASA